MNKAFLLVVENTASFDRVLQFLSVEPLIQNWHAPFENSVFLISSSDSESLRDSLRKNLSLRRFLIVELNVRKLGKNLSGWLPAVSWQFLLSRNSNAPAEIQEPHKSYLAKPASTREFLADMFEELATVMEELHSQSQIVHVALNDLLPWLSKVKAEIIAWGERPPSGSMITVLDDFAERVDQCALSIDRVADKIQLIAPRAAEILWNIGSAAVNADERIRARLMVVDPIVDRFIDSQQAKRDASGDLWQAFLVLNGSKALDLAKHHLLRAIAQYDGELAVTVRLLTDGSKALKAALF